MLLPEQEYKAFYGSVWRTRGPCTRVSPRRVDEGRERDPCAHPARLDREQHAARFVVVHKRVQAAINQAVSPINESRSRFVRKLQLSRELFRRLRFLGPSSSFEQCARPPPPPCAANFSRQN